MGVEHTSVNTRHHHASAQSPAPRRIRGLTAAERSQHRRTQILEAALELFASRGYPNTSVELICHTSFVSTRSFYQIFDDRESCYLALYEQIATQYREAISAIAFTTHSDADDQARFIIESYVNLVLVDRRKALITFGHVHAYSDRINEARHANRSWTADLLEQIWAQQGLSVPPRRVVVALVAGIFEVVIEVLRDNPNEGDIKHDVINDLVAFYSAVRTGFDAAERTEKSVRAPRP